MKKVLTSTVVIVAAMVLVFGSAKTAEKLGYPGASEFLTQQGDKLYAAYQAAGNTSPTVVQ